MPPEPPETAPPSGDRVFKYLCLWETSLIPVITLVLISIVYVVFVLLWLCGKVDKPLKTNRSQTKPVLRVLFLLLFSMGLSFIPEFILNLIWFLQ